MRLNHCVVVVILHSLAAVAMAGETEDLVARGKQLFQKRWTPGDSQSPAGDGLGPMHNDVSCVACHSQGGIGGGGPLKNNVDVLALVPPKSRTNQKSFPARVGRLHPGFTSNGSLKAHIILHRFGVNPNYDGLRRRLLGDNSDRLRGLPTQHAREISFEPSRELEVDGVHFIHVQRNSSAIFGAGLIDKIPDDVIRKEAARQATLRTGVSGRVAPIQPGGVGRFGWRGQTAHLKDFVLGACAAELGLQTQGNPQAVDPLQPARDTRRVDDLKGDEVQAMVAFLASLPAPRQVIPTDSVEAESTRRGQRIFMSIGCADCHREQLGDVEGIYSDLLLHDMGQALADPAGAELPQEMIARLSQLSKASRARPSGGYLGNQRNPLAVQQALRANRQLRQVMDASFREYRTPPLWGLRDSEPYMHDGRAQTITEAIALHGGEGLQSSTKFFDLDGEMQRAVVDFLNSLAAPELKTGE